VTSDYERYHGVVLRELIVKAEAPLLIETRDDTGRVNSFRLNGRTGIHIKHSSKRLAPWQFTFNEDNWREVQILCEECLSAWVVFVCGLDGIVCLSVAELEKVTEAEAASTRFIRVNRDRATMYRIFGNDGKLDSPKARGVAPVLLDAFSK
jgi:hypothetical protein